MIKLFFFGTLPLGWKRFFRAISFVWAVVCLYNAFYIGISDRDGQITLLFSFGAPMVISYSISGFFGKKTD
jgi:hypothetical protein